MTNIYCNNLVSSFVNSYGLTEYSFGRGILKIHKICTYLSRNKCLLMSYIAFQRIIHSLVPHSKCLRKLQNEKVLQCKKWTFASIIAQFYGVATFVFFFCFYYFLKCSKNFMPFPLASFSCTYPFFSAYATKQFFDRG